MARAVFALVAALLVVLLATPMLFAGGDPPPTCSAIVPSSMAAILATIRELESGGNYQARASGSSASGAYQFLDSTWDGYGGYPSAWLAPPEVQDAKAAPDLLHLPPHVASQIIKRPADFLRAAKQHCEPDLPF